MSKNNLTAPQFIALAEKRGWHLDAIVKDVPAGSGRKMLFGFEYKKRSRKHRIKWLLKNPISLDELSKGPIKASATANVTTNTPANESR